MRCRVSGAVLAASLAALAACAAVPTARPVDPAVDAQPGPTVELDASPYGLFLAGSAARDEGEFDAAASYLAKASADEGEPTFLKADAFHAALESGDIVAAVSLAPSGPDVAPGDLHLAALAHGVESLAEGKYKEAYAALIGPDQGFPYKPAAALLAPFAALAAGDDTDAVARPEVGSDSVAQLVGDLDQTGIYERLGRFKDAEAGYKALSRTGGAGGIIAAKYGAFLERRHRTADAVAVYKAALAQAPDDVVLGAALIRAQNHARPPPIGDVRQSASEALVIPGASLVARKQLELALIDLRLALRLDPANDEAWMLVGDILSLRDMEAARAAYERVGVASPRYVTARDKLAYSYERTGEPAEALKIARDTAVAAPASRDALVTLANVLRDNGQYAESAAVLTKLIDAGSAHPDWRLYYLRASAYDETGDREKTQADLSVALRLNPDEPDLLNFQGYFWIERGEHLDEALVMVQRAVDAEPQSGPMIDSLGWAYYRLGDFKSAATYLENAVSLDPSVPEVNDHLGDAYWRVGRKTEAVFEWRRVLSLDPAPKLKAAVIAKLASPLGPDAPVPAAPPATTQAP